MHALELDHVTKRFADVVAVDDVSLTLGEREVVALVGPSGCGKSTLLRAVAGLHGVDDGRITLGGRLVDDGRTVLPPERRRVGLVFQEHALFPHLSVADNIAFGVRSEPSAPRTAEMLELVGLVGYADRYPHELSGGERQRVALARALAPRPALMLLDEPFASLDTNLRARVRDDVIGILRSTGTPAVFVTHDQHDALAVGDRVAVMRSGAVVQAGDPVEVFHQPVDRFVASFLGEADFSTWGAVASDLGPIPATDPVPDETATVMTRPDDVTFVVASGGDAVVERAEFRGTEWCYTLRLRSGARVRSLRSHLERVEIGARADVALNPGHLPVVVRD